MVFSVVFSSIFFFFPLPYVHTNVYYFTYYLLKQSLHTRAGSGQLELQASITYFGIELSVKYVHV